MKLGGTPTAEERECSQGMMGNGFEASFKPSSGWETAVEEVFVLQVGGPGFDSETHIKMSSIRNKAITNYFYQLHK